MFGRYEWGRELDRPSSGEASVGTGGRGRCHTGSRCRKPLSLTLVPSTLKDGGDKDIVQPQSVVRSRVRCTKKIVTRGARTPTRATVIRRWPSIE
jgi:hypothetical protein